MAYLEAVTLRQAVQARCVAALTGYTRSAYPFEMLPASSRDLQHKAFAVGLGRTVNYVPRQRQKVSKGVSVLTRVMVSYTYRLRADGMVSDLNAAMGGEVEVAEAVKALTLSGLSGLTVEDASRSVDGVLFKSTITFRAIHKIRTEAVIMPSYTTRRRIEVALDAALLPNANTGDGGAVGDSYSWTVTVPVRGIVHRASIIIQSTNWGPDYSTNEDKGAIYVLTDGAADQHTGTNPLTEAQANSIIAASPMNGFYANNMGGMIRLVYQWPLSVYAKMFVLDFNAVMPIGVGTVKANQGSGPVGFYYDLSAIAGADATEGTLYFTWVAHNKNWSDNPHSAKFVIEIEPTVTG